MADDETTDATESEQEQEQPKPDSQPSSDRTFTQADIDRVVKERLAKERSKLGDVNELRRKAGEYDKLAEANKTELEKLADKAAAESERAAAAELRALRLEVAHVKGLTPTQAKRLVGETREELEADADELLADFKPPDDEKKPPAGQRPSEDLPKVPLPNSKDIHLDDETDPRVLAKRIRRI